MPAGLARQSAAIGLTVAFGALGGLLFAALGTPLPYMLGAMTFTIVGALGGLPLAMPRWARNTIAPVLGVMFGSVLDVSGIPAGWTLVVLAGMVILYFILTIGLGWLFMRRIGYDPVTSYFASVPGNLSEVSVVAEALGANLRAVVLAHSARIVITVTTISFGLRYGLGLSVVGLVPRAGPSPEAADLAILAACAAIGYLFARILRLPSPHLLGPLAFSVVVHSVGWTTAAPPAAMVASAQIALGTFIGARFTGVKLREVTGTLAISAAWGVILLCLIAAYALLASWILGEHYPAMVLAFAPGGVAEVSALAIAAHLSLGFVTTVQIIRMTCVIIIGPIVVRRLFGTGPSETKA